MLKYILMILVVLISPAMSAPVACGTADDTPAIQAMLNATNQVEFPSGVICKVSTINAANKFGPRFWSQGGFNSMIVPIQSGVNMFDFTGTGAWEMDNFWIHGGDCTNPPPGVVGVKVPSTAILSAQSDFTYNSDVNRINRVRVNGCFSLAAHYDLQVASSWVFGSQFYNYGGFTVIHTGNNFFGATSQFTTINTKNDHQPSDWTYLATELHNLANQNALWIGGVRSFRYYGGNISSSIHPVSMNAVVISGVGQQPGEIIFDGTTFYNDLPPSPPCAVKLNTAVIGGTQFRANQAGFPLTC